MFPSRKQMEMKQSRDQSQAIEEHRSYGEHSQHLCWNAVMIWQTHEKLGSVKVTKKRDTTSDGIVAKTINGTERWLFATGVWCWCGHWVFRSWALETEQCTLCIPLQHGSCFTHRYWLSTPQKVVTKSLRVQGSNSLQRKAFFPQYQAFYPVESEGRSLGRYKN